MLSLHRARTPVDGMGTFGGGWDLGVGGWVAVVVLCMCLLCCVSCAGLCCAVLSCLLVYRH